MNRDNIFGSSTVLWFNGLSSYLCGNYENFRQDEIVNINLSMSVGFHDTFLSHMKILNKQNFNG